MKLQKLDISMYIISMIIIFGFIIMGLPGCHETWRNIGKDVKNVAQGTGNAVKNVFGQPEKQY